jgi:hypothetical protein
VTLALQQLLDLFNGSCPALLLRVLQTFEGGDLRSLDCEWLRVFSFGQSAQDSTCHTL